MEQKIKDALDQIRPFLQRDGGDIEFVEYTDDNIVRVRLQGHRRSGKDPEGKLSGSSRRRGGNVRRC